MIKIKWLRGMPISCRVSLRYYQYSSLQSIRLIETVCNNVRLTTFDMSCLIFVIHLEVCMVAESTGPQRESRSMVN